MTSGNRCEACEGTGIVYHMSEFADRCRDCDGIGRTRTRCVGRDDTCLRDALPGFDYCRVCIEARARRIRW